VPSRDDSASLRLSNDDDRTPLRTAIERPLRTASALAAPVIEPPIEPQVEIDVELDHDTDETRPPARMFGRYSLLGRIAIGGMAEIYLAKEIVDGAVEREVVVKVLKSEMASDPDFVLLFRDEARIATQLRHPYIAHVYECGQVDSRHYIAMEWVNGVTLSAHTKRLRKNRDRIPLPIALRMVCDVAEALEYAHNARGADGKPLGIVHRDVSPQNIVVSYDGVVKLLDFGVAKATRRLTSTSTGTVRGKFAYMSPEQCIGNDEIDGRSDLFSLGVVLHELVTGAPLFERDTDFETMRAVASATIAAPNEIDPSIPAELSRIVMRALEVLPRDRYGSARELHEELQHYLLQRNETVSSARVGDYVRHVWADAIEDGVDLATETDFLGVLPRSRAEMTPTPILRDPTRPTKLATAPEPYVPRENRGFKIGISEVVAAVLMAGLIAWLLWPSGANPIVKRLPEAAGALSIETVPAGATASIGERVLGVTPLSRVAVPLGNGTLRLELEGHAPASLELSFEKRHETISRTLVENPTPTE
jgi:serine/threonine protein kinase